MAFTAIATALSFNAWSQEEPSSLIDPYKPAELLVKPGQHAAFSESVNAYFYPVGYATPHGLFTCPFPALSPFTQINTGTVTFYGGDIGPNGVFYAITDDERLMTIDKATGTQTFIANVTGITESNITGMAYHEATNTMYVSTGTRLLTVDLTTGATTVIGNFNTVSLVIFIAINCEGEMYGVDIAADVLVKINTSTGAATIIGPTNYPTNYAQSGDFDNETGTLYWAAYVGSGASSIRTLDLATGNSTLVVDTYPYEIEAFVIDNGCAPPVPLSGWALFIGIALIVSFTVIRFRKFL